MRIKLEPHQYEIIEKIYNENIKKKILWCDAGTGKTIIGLTLREIYDPEKVLIITKPILIKNAWMFDAERFGFKDLEFITSKKCITLNKRANIQGITTYDLANINIQYLRKIDWDMLILDESHLIGNYSSKRSKSIAGKFRYGMLTGQLKAKRCYLMTGSLKPNRREQVYPQMLMTGYRNTYTNFKREFFYQPSSMHPHWWKFNEEREPEFNNLVKQHSFVIRKSDTDLNKLSKNWNYIEFPMDDKSLKIQKELMKNGIYEDDEMSIIIKHNIAIIQKLRQLSRGFIHEDVPVLDENGKQKIIRKDNDIIPMTETKVHTISRNSYKYLVDYIIDEGDAENEPVVVFYNYVHEKEQILSLIPKKIKVWTVNGQNTPKMNDKNINEFKKSKNGVMLVQYATGKNGLTLTNSNRMFFFSLVDDQEVFEQAQDRIHRYGQTRDCHYYIFKCIGSIDEKILESLENKKNINEELKKWIKEKK